MRLAALVLLVPTLVSAPAHADVSLGNDWYAVFGSGAPPNKPGATRSGKITAVTKTGATLVIDKTTFHLTGLALPLKAGDTVDESVQCFSQGPNQFCDAVLSVGGAPFAIASGSGATAIAKGWDITATPAPKTCKSAATCSEHHEMPLVFKHGKQQVATKPNGWVAIDGWMVTGSSISWEGMRPPEGVDYQSFTMIRNK